MYPDEARDAVQGGGSAAPASLYGEAGEASGYNQVNEPVSSQIPSGAPVNLTEGQAMLSVVLDEDLEGAQVFVDGQLVGTPPWQGIVAPGDHTVKVTAPGYFDKEKETTIWPQRTRTLEMSLHPSEKFDTGPFFMGITWESGIGDGSWDLAIGPGGLLGWEIPFLKVNLEIGLALGPVMLFEFKDEEETIGVPGGINGRLLVGIKKPWIFWSVELEPALFFDFSGAVGAQATLRSGFSFFLGEWFEVRLNPVGLRGRYSEVGPRDEDDVEGNRRFVSVIMYTPQCALLMRF